MSLQYFVNLIHWSLDNFSELPWRKKRSLYHTLVSEIMLQQTTVGTVLNHFDKFINAYPTIFDLAKASEEEVCIAWKGLGYYRRARSLRNIALLLVEKFKAEIPLNLEELLTLKGVGLYTAHALMAMGGNLKALALDANVIRVLSRFYGITDLAGIKLQQKLWEQFNNQQILSEMDQLGPRLINEALMDLGRVHCQAKKTNCSLCLLSDDCKSFQGGLISSALFSEKKTKADRFYLKLLRVVVSEKGKILFYQKSSTEWLSFQWELPTFILDTNDETLNQYPKILMQDKFLNAPVIKTSITKYSIENFVVKMSLEEFQHFIKTKKMKYVFKKYSKELNLSTASIKVLKKGQDLL